MALALISISCSVLQPQKSYTLEYIVDFSEYTQKGFLFTPEKYNGEYESIGLIALEAHPEILIDLDKLTMIEKDGNIIYKTNNTDGYRKVKIGTTAYYIKDLELQEVIKQFYDKAKIMGADATMNFEYKFILAKYSASHYNAIRISGFAIKRRAL